MALIFVQKKKQHRVVVSASLIYLPLTYGRFGYVGVCYLNFTEFVFQDIKKNQSHILICGQF